MNRYIEMLLKLNEQTIDTTVDAVQLANIQNDKNAVLGGLVGQNEHYSNLILAIASQGPLKSGSRMYVIGRLVEKFFERRTHINRHFKKKKPPKYDQIYRIGDFAVDWVLEMRGFHERNIPNRAICEELSERLDFFVSQSAYEKTFESQLSAMVSDLSLKVNDICDRAYKTIG